MVYHLAQVNIARMLAPLTDPLMAGFVAELDAINALADLTTFAYKSRHRQILQQRQLWFQRFNGPYVALWWVSSGHIPTVEEAKERLSYLSAHGETPYAFSFKKPLTATESVSDLPTYANME